MSGPLMSYRMMGALALLVLSAFARGSPGQIPASEPARAASVAEQYLLAAANQEREARGLPTLALDEALGRAARSHALVMAARGAISHQFAGEPGLAERAGAAGAAFSLVTENVAEASDAAGIHDLWMHSAGHRANLLDPAVDTLGIAVVSRGGQYYAVEDFARSVPRRSLEAQELAVAALLQRSGLQVVPGAPQARASCPLEEGYAGAPRPWFVMHWSAADVSRVPDALLARLATGRYHQALIGACTPLHDSPFTHYLFAVLLNP